jgi:3'-5' exoribonuclease Rv2179c-like domain
LITYRNVMLDLETWGTSAGCAIRSIGAVFFDWDKPLGPAFYANVTEESCVALGLTIDPVVVAWWGEQSAEAQAALDTNRVPVTDALTDFVYFFEQADEPEEVCLWSHGATFDIPITDFAMRKAGMRPPWKFQNCRDTRTLIWLAGEMGHTWEAERVGVRHQALDDAKTRSLQMMELRRRIPP